MMYLAYMQNFILRIKAELWYIMRCYRECHNVGNADAWTFVDGDCGLVKWQTTVRR